MNDKHKNNIGDVVIPALLNDTVYEVIRKHGGNLCDECSKCSTVCPVQIDVAKKRKLASEFQDENNF